MIQRSQSAFASAIALSLSLTACGDPHTANHSLYSVAQPVVEHHTFTLDLAGGVNGLPIGEQRRLNDWFETMDLRYGDRIGLDGQPTSVSVRNDVAAIAGRYGLLLSDGAPVTEGYVAPGNVRVVVTRSRAYVPNCPNWGHQFRTTLGNETADGYGCAINANVAAMVADPEHLLHGAEGTGQTVVMSGDKAIKTYREADPTGKAGLPKISSQSAGSGG
jgi:pilus assembly protein CpaD